MANRSVLVALVSAIGLAALAIWLLGDRGAPAGVPPGTGSGNLPAGEVSGPVPRGRSRLAIRVETEAGGGVPGAAVTIRGVVVVERNTGGDGLSVFDGIPVGPYEVVVSAEGYPELGSAEAVHVTRRGEEMRCVVRQFEVSIAGKVMDSRGAPLAGVTARCEPMHWGVDEIVLERVGSPSRTDSDAQGVFEISGLAPGEYRIETEPRPGYSQARMNVIAPSEGALLVLYEEQSIVVSGVVTDAESRPLEGAEVVAAGGGSTRTDEEGRYRLPVKTGRGPGSTPALSASKAGYSEQHKTSAVSRDLETRELEISFRLEPVTDAGTVLGTLVDTNGAPIPAESVHLQSTSRGTRYRAMASPEGRFRFEGVRSADDYVLAVYPTADYRDKTIEPVEIGAGVSQIEVVLEPIEKATFNGTIVDAVGAPVPHFTVWVKNVEQRAGSMRVMTDSVGRFRTSVPAGDLVIETRALPKVTVSGLRTEPGQEFSATLPIGVGERTVRGRVVLPDGSPVAGARVVVTWSHRGTGFRSSLFNEALSDRTGDFELPGLGPGTCVVSVSAVGVDSTRVSFQIPRGTDPERLRIELR